MTFVSSIAKATAAAALGLVIIGGGNLATATQAEAGKKKVGIHLQIGGPVYGGYYGYGPYYRVGYVNPCRWHYRRAVRTGSPFHWNSYHACMHRHGW